MTDREKLEAVNASYQNLLALYDKQKATTAKMIRACVYQMSSPKASEREKAKAALIATAELLEKAAEKNNQPKLD